MDIGLRRFGIFTSYLLALCALLGAGIGRSEAAPPDINLYTSTKLKSLELDSEVLFEKRAELEKIGGDFANVYRLHKMSMAYVQPGKIHLETIVLGAHISYTINGNTRYTSIPTVHVHKVESLTGAPRKKQTLLDSGLVPPELLTDWNAVFQRKAGKYLLYILTPKQAGETAHELIWLDPVTHITARRNNYGQDGKLVKWIQYMNPVKTAAGVYIPTRIEVYNAENKLAAVTAYRNIRVNLPVDDAVFNF